MTSTIALWVALAFVFIAVAGVGFGMSVVLIATRSEYERRLRDLRAEYERALSTLRTEHERDKREMQTQVDALRAEVKMWSDVTARVIRQGGGGGIEIHAGEDVSISGDAIGRDRLTGAGGSPA